MSTFFVGFTGHRDRFTDLKDLAKILSLYPGAIWVHGGAKGFDTQVNDFAKGNGFTPIVIPPDYLRHKNQPKSAPIMRNYVIVDLCNALVACWDGRLEGGTYRTIQYAEKAGKIVTYVKCI